jgi:hypothetical protein
VVVGNSRLFANKRFSSFIHIGTQREMILKALPHTLQQGKLTNRAKTKFFYGAYTRKKFE